MKSKRYESAGLGFSSRGGALVSRSRCQDTRCNPTREGLCVEKQAFKVVEVLFRARLPDGS